MGSKYKIIDKTTYVYNMKTSHILGYFLFYINNMQKKRILKHIS